MTRSTLLCAVGGFLAGSAVATAVTYSLAAKQRTKSKTVDTTKDFTEDLRRSLVATGDVERVSFLTEIIAQLWDYLNVAGADTIRETLEPMLTNMTPAILVTKIDLGKVPIRLDNIYVHNIKDGVLSFDMDVIWDGECDIQMKANYIGSFGVKQIKLKGRMSVLLKPLTNQLPVVSAIQYAFINPPHLMLNFTGLAQLADFKVIHDAIHKIAQDSLAAMMVLPNRMLYKMDLANNYLDTYHPPLGIARITLVKGRGFQVEKRSLRSVDIPDVYCLVTVGGSGEWKTSTIKNNLSPEWNESADFLFTNHQQLIQIEAWDEDAGALDADDFLGKASISVGELLLAGRTKDIKLEMKGEETGAYLSLCCDLKEWTTDLTSFERNASEHNTLCGLLTIIVTRAFAIPVERVEAASFVKVSYGANEFYTSQVSHYPGIDAINPEYNCAFHVPFTPELANGDMDVVFSLYNGEDLLGIMNVPKASVMDAPEKTITERRPIGDKGASLEFRVSLRGIRELVSRVTLPAVPSMEVSEPTPREASLEPKEEETNKTKTSGTVRITAVRGRGFKVQKRRFLKDDVPDIYLNLKFDSDDYIWRTSTVRNSISPEWNESADFSLFHHDQVIVIDLFDEDRNASDADDELGNVRITVGELLLAGGGTELAVKQKGRPTGAFITLQCDIVESAAEEQT